jgi:hypothetical protein
MGSAFTLTPDTSKTDLTTTATTATATTITRTNIGGTAGTGIIIGTITIAIMIATTTGIDSSRFSLPTKELLEGTIMKSLLSVIALAFGALTFQSCEVYPNGTSRGYYDGGYYGGDGYYDGGYYSGGDYGPTVVVSSGYREHHHGDGYSNEYYDRENNHINRNDHVNGNANVNRNVNANRNVQVNRNVNANRNGNGNRNVNTNRNVHPNRNVHVNRDENAGHQ